jgi:hypothetical protein
MYTKAKGQRRWCPYDSVQSLDADSIRLDTRDVGWAQPTKSVGAFEKITPT